MNADPRIERRVENQIRQLDRRLNNWMDHSPLNRSWITSNPVSIYVRKGPIYIDGRIQNAITLATIDVKVRRQRQGWFGRVISWMHTTMENPMNGVTALKVENVLHDFMVASLQRRGWRIISPPGDLGPPSLGLTRDWWLI